MSVFACITDSAVSGFMAHAHCQVSCFLRYNSCEIVETAQPSSVDVASAALGTF